VADSWDLAEEEEGEETRSCAETSEGEATYSSVSTLSYNSKFSPYICHWQASRRLLDWDRESVHGRTYSLVAALRVQPLIFG